MQFPARLQPGDEVRVVAPARSLAMITDDSRVPAARRFTEMGLNLTFGDNVEHVDQFVSSSIEDRLHDLHAAFADTNVKAILTVIGGFNSNQLLPYLDWDLVAANPKIFCGYSDITAMSCSMYAKTGLVTYSGPHYSSFGMEHHFDYTLDEFKRAMFDGGEQTIAASSYWTDDEWYLHQDDREVLDNEGHWVMQSGQAQGPLIGGNLCTLNLLHGTEFMPDLAGAVVFVEDDFESMPHTFDRDLTSLIQQPGFDQVQGLLIGRFQRSVEMSRSKLQAIIDSKQELQDMPVVANMDFGHTNPVTAIPVGGLGTITALADGGGESSTVTVNHDA